MASHLSRHSLGARAGPFAWAWPGPPFGGLEDFVWGLLLCRTSLQLCRETVYSMASSAWVWGLGQAARLFEPQFPYL